MVSMVTPVSVCNHGGMKNTTPTSPIVTEISALIGADSAMTLIELFGGKTLIIGAAKRQLIPAIGESKYQSLLHRFGLCPLYIPVLMRAKVEERNQAIIAEFDAITGHQSARAAVKELATRYQLTERHIWRVLKK